MILHYKAGNAESHKAIGAKLSKLHPGEYVIEVTKNRPIRSISHNKFYWGIVLKLISVQVGHPVEDLHEMFKAKFNPKIIEFKNGAKEVLPGSTSDMDTKEFSRYIDQVKGWATGFCGVTFPEEKDVDYQRWMEIKSSYDRVFNEF